MKDKGKGNQRAGKDAKPARNEQANAPDRITLVMELGETNPQSAATEYRETRGQHNFYLAIQLVLAIITAIGVGIALCSLKDLNRSVIAANAQASAAITQANIAIAAGQARMVPTDHKASGLNISLYFLNAGISPAVNVYGLTEYALGSGMSIPTPQFAPDCAHLKSKQPAPTKISFPVVLPKDTFSIDPIQDIPAGWSAEANADEIQQFPVRIGPGAGRIVPTNPNAPYSWMRLVHRCPEQSGKNDRILLHGKQKSASGKLARHGQCLPL